MRYRSYNRLQQYVHRGYEWQHQVIRRALAEHVRVHGGRAARVLELACGGGNMADLFSSADYLGVDLTPERIEAAAAAHPGHAFKVSDVTSPEFASLLEARDFVFCHGLLHHLDDEQCRCMIELIKNRALHPATFVAIEPWSPPAFPNLVGHLLCKLDDGKFIRPRHGYAKLFGQALEREEVNSNWPRWPVHMEAYVAVYP